jgi:hypothetical protein
MEQHTSMSAMHALKAIHGRSGSDRRRSPTPTRAALVSRAGKQPPRNGVRPAVTARGRAVLAQQRRQLA